MEMKLNFIFAAVFKGSRRVLTEGKAFIEMPASIASSAVAQVVTRPRQNDLSGWRTERHLPERQGGRSGRERRIHNPEADGSSGSGQEIDILLITFGEVAQVVRAQDS